MYVNVFMFKHTRSLVFSIIFNIGEEILSNHNQARGSVINKLLHV